MSCVKLTLSLSFSENIKVQKQTFYAVSTIEILNTLQYSNLRATTDRIIYVLGLL